MCRQFAYIGAGGWMAGYRWAGVELDENIFKKI
jgi:hypothetical protein